MQTVPVKGFDFEEELDGQHDHYVWMNAAFAMGVNINRVNMTVFATAGALGAIAVVTKHEIVLAVVGGLFVVEALSVIIQVLYFKRTGKRVFKMAPIHHHFERLRAG